MAETAIPGVFILMAAGYICFRNIFICLVFLPVFVKFFKDRGARRRSLERKKEFKDIMAVLYSSAASGATLEKAFQDALYEMKRTPDRYPLLIPEIEAIMFKTERNIPLLSALNDFSHSSEDDDISDFVQVLIIAGRSGGSLSSVIKRTSDAISLKMDINEELENMLAGRKGEFKVMMIVPAGIIMYMNLCSPEYMKVLYDGIAGHVIMAVLLSVYIAAVYMGYRILDIKI